MKKYYYNNNVAGFLSDNTEKIIGDLTLRHHFSLEINQKNAWVEQIQNLKEQLSDLMQGEIYFEFSIPRMGKRADVILLINNIVFVIEYKTGSQTYEQYQIDQPLDYALDLKNFHLASHHKNIIPILISTKAPTKKRELSWFADGVANTLLSNGKDLKDIISQALLSNFSPSEYQLNDNDQQEFNTKEWAESGYKPTPTIIEAAQALYSGHSVQEISRSDAGAKNLTITTDYINKIISNSRESKRKSICFVTGVPGAGKTLAGLNISTQKLQNPVEDEAAVFLSGNGPLVAILREALVRDEVDRSKIKGSRLSKETAKRNVCAFIQNIHHFRDEALKSDYPPTEHVVIFDEAQRAWNKAQAKKFMTQKRGVASFEMSEPEFLIDYMDRKKDWCTVICLIGGGQEINTGEAGIAEWIYALKNKFSHWHVYHSTELENKNYNWGVDLKQIAKSLNATEASDLHLSVSIRSYRAEKLSEFIGAVIDGNRLKAKQILPALDNYPIRITRDIDVARKWLRGKARGTERLGLVASSGAVRLKPEGVNIKAEIDPVTWFLNGKEDVRSSYYLEDVATEFHVQGLELDWVGVCWDADFRFNASWESFSFKGTKWQSVKDDYRRTYLANAYRVLLTRARQGIIIFVPTGSMQDKTRLPDFYDGTYEFLQSCGLLEDWN